MRGGRRQLAKLCALVPEADRQAVEDAAFELESYGLVQITWAIGRGNWWLSLTPPFYEQLDDQVMGWDTGADAATLAELLLEDEKR